MKGQGLGLCYTRGKNPTAEEGKRGKGMLRLSQGTNLRLAESASTYWGGGQRQDPPTRPFQRSQHLRLLQEQPLNLLRMKALRSPRGGLRGLDPHPGAGAGGLLEAGGGHHC